MLRQRITNTEMALHPQISQLGTLRNEFRDTRKVGGPPCLGVTFDVDESATSTDARVLPKLSERIDGQEIGRVECDIHPLVLFIRYLTTNCLALAFAVLEKAKWGAVGLPLLARPRRSQARRSPDSKHSARNANTSNTVDLPLPLGPSSVVIGVRFLNSTFRKARKFCTRKCSIRGGSNFMGPMVDISRILGSLSYDRSKRSAQLT